MRSLFSLAQAALISIFFLFGCQSDTQKSKELPANVEPYKSSKSDRFEVITIDSDKEFQKVLDKKRSYYLGYDESRFYIVAPLPGGYIIHEGVYQMDRSKASNETLRKFRADGNNPVHRTQNQTTRGFARWFAAIDPKNGVPSK